MIFLLCIALGNGYKILFITFVNGKSHWLYFQKLVKALLDRQHEVTCVTSRTWAGLKPTNYTEILAEPYDLSKAREIQIRKIHVKFQ